MNIALVCGNYSPERFGGSLVSTEALAIRFSQYNNVEIVCGGSEQNDNECNYRLHRLGIFPYLSFHPGTTNIEKRHLASIALETYFDRCSQFVTEQSYSVIDVQGPWCETASIVTVRFVYPEYLEILKNHSSAFVTSDPWSEKLLELERRTYEAPTVEHFIAVSTKAKRELQKHYGIHENSITVVNNGVDVKRFGRSALEMHRRKIRNKLGIGKKELVITYCGNNYVRKNLSVFLKVARKFYGHGIRLAMIAQGRRDGELINQEDKDHIAYFEMTNFPEKILAATDILLFPTLYDTCAKIVLEAMAMGIPVVVSKASGLADIIVNNQSGFIVDSPTDVEQFQQVVGKLIHNASLRHNVGMKAEQVIAENFSWDVVAVRVYGVYQRVLNRLS